MDLIRLIFAVFMVNLTDSMKVRERFLRYQSGHARCIIAVSHKHLYGDQIHPIFTSFYRSITYAARNLNCSMIEDKQGLWRKIPKFNETYGGWVGTIQRNKADLSLWMIRPDLVPGEPGKIGPALMSGDLVIISSLYHPEVRRYDLTKFLDLSLFTYITMFVFIFFLVPMVYIYAEENIMHVERHLKAPKLLKKYIICCEKVVYLILDQEQFTATTFAGLILSFTASIFTLFIIHGFFLNTLGADLVSNRAQPPIDSLDDLLASNVTPAVVDKSFAYNVFMSAPVDTKEHQVWLRIQERMPGSVFIPTGKDPIDPINNTVRRVWSHEAVYIEIEEGAQLFPYLTCAGNLKESLGETSAGFHMSSQRIANGLMTGLFSHQIHPYTEKVLRSIMSVTFESGLTEGFLSLMRFTAPDMWPGELRVNSRTLQCLDREPKDEPDSGPLDVPTLKNFLVAWSSIWILAFIALIFEIVSRSIHALK